MLRALLAVALIAVALGLGVLGYRMAVPGAPQATEAAPAPPPAPPAPVRIAVAARPLPAGTLLKDEDLTVREVAPDAVPEGAIAPGEESRAELHGALVRRYVEAGAALHRADVLRTRDRGFLAAVLRPGSRAIAVGVDVVTGAAGLIWPGDQVDLVLTQELASADAPLARRVIGETVLADVRVIAVDQQFARGASPSEALSGRIARTVTLEVSAEQAERVAVAGRLGRIALTVRAMERLDTEVASAGAPTPDKGAALAGAGGGPVFGADVSPALARTALPAGARMRVIQGDERAEVVFR